MANPSILPPLLPGEPGWSAEDAAALRAFILTASGQRWLRSLLFRRPAVASRTDPEVRRIQSDERAGFEACIAETLQLAEPPPTTAADEAAQSRT